MKDQILLAVTEVLDSDYGGDSLCEQEVHTFELQEFLKTHRETGLHDICEQLDFLREAAKRCLFEITAKNLDPQTLKHFICNGSAMEKDVCREVWYGRFRTVYKEEAQP
jgi:hypothetical protein